MDDKAIKKSYQKTVLQQVRFLLMNDEDNSFAEDVARAVLTQLSTEGILTVMYDAENDSEGLTEDIESYLEEEKL